MLIQPTIKFFDYVLYSKHYLNCPKHILNYQLRSMIQLCVNNYDIAELRVKEAKKHYNLSIPNIREFIEYHWKTKESEFNILNTNPFIDNPPKYVIDRDNFINNWYATKTREVWRFGHLVETIAPHSPFKY